MGTKNNPGPTNCYERAYPDEPLFTLLARDPCAPLIIRIWAELRREVARRMGVPGEDVSEARDIACEMEKWAAIRCPEKDIARREIGIIANEEWSAVICRQQEGSIAHGFDSGESHDDPELLDVVSAHVEAWVRREANLLHADPNRDQARMTIVLYEKAFADDDSHPLLIASFEETSVSGGADYGRVPDPAPPRRR